MADLIYSAITSLDGYVEDASGRFDWAVPDDDVMVFLNELERPIGTYLYGRRMFETMLYWETADTVAGHSEADRDFTSIWQGADKVVYSRTLGVPATRRTRIEREFDPETVRQLKADSDADLTVGGADLAGQAVRAGLVDELQLYLVPVVVGAGKHYLPGDVRLDLELRDEHRFDGGFVFLRYRVKS
jgi:dihydrofolate reductase